jgi:hypothetical protein
VISALAAVGLGTGRQALPEITVIDRARVDQPPA